jgi:predicted dehydrogenase
MIRLGLAGLADRRYQWFLAPLHRRRAGIRLVGASEPDADLRSSAPVGDLPIHPDHLQLLEQARPDLLAVTRFPGADRVIIDALGHGVDVVAVPPLADDLVQLDAIAEAAAASGRRCLTTHTLRGQPGALVAQQLLLDGRLGTLEVVTLIVPDDCHPEQRRSLITDVLDLFCWLAGVHSGTITAIGDGHPARTDDPPEFTAGYGTLIMMVHSTSPLDGAGIVCEVRSRPGAAEWPVTVQVGGSTGAVEWDVGSGMLRSVVTGTEPRLISAGRIDHPEWVLNNLLRKRTPAGSTAHSLATTRMLLLAGRSAENGGRSEQW